MPREITFLPPDLQAEQAGVERSRRFAEALMGQGLQAFAPRQAGRYTVAPHPLEGLARVLQVYAGTKAGERADQAGVDIARRAAAQRQEAIGRALSTAMGAPGEQIGLTPMDDEGNAMRTPGRAPDPLGAYGQLAATGDPVAGRMGADMIGYLQRQEEGRLGREARMDERAMALDAQAAQFAAGSAERRAAEQRSADLRRELMASQQSFAAQQAAANRAFMAANRPPEALQQVEDPTSPTGVRLVPRSQAVGQPAPRQERNLTEGQGKAALYGTRMAMSDRALTELEDKISTTGLAAKQAAANTPVVGGLLGAAGNVLLSADQQRVEQAQRDFVNATLRQESGAVIRQPEFDNAKKQYFPQPGDSKAVIEQKRANRQLAIAGFRRMAGPAGAEIDDSMKGTPNLAGTPRRRATDQQPQNTSGGVIDFSKLPPG